MAYNTDPRLLAAIRNSGADPDTQAVLLATTWVESGGRLDAVGDGGKSHGPYQEYDHGRGAGIPIAQRRDPTAATTRALKEFQQFQRKGLKGGALAAAAQRPANQGAYSQKVEGLIADARKALGGQATSNQLQDFNQVLPNRPSLGGAGTSTTAGVGAGIADAIANRPKGQGLSSTVMQGLLASVGQPATSEAAGVKANPQGLLNQPAAGGGAGEGVVGAAKRWLGTPYSWGGGNTTGPTGGIAGPARGGKGGIGITGFDCSSLVQHAWAKMGVKLPRVTYDQIKVGQGINTQNMAAWKPGDLIFPHRGHVQMYIGNGKVIHAPRTGGVVEIIPVGKVMAVRRPG